MGARTAIGDAGNRATLDFLDGVIESVPEARELRHRIEHAQVLHLQVGHADHDRLLAGSVVLTVVGGSVVHRGFD